MDKARKQLEREVDIVEIVRSRRYFHMALKHLLTPSVRKDLKTRSQVSSICDSDMQEEACNEVAAIKKS